MSNEKTAKVQAAAALPDGAPSAPPIVREEIQTASCDAAPHTAPSTNPQVIQGQTTATVVQNPSPYSEPPPSYQMAVSYPTTPYPASGQSRMPMPTVSPGYLPKPYPSYHPSQPPIYFATHTVGVGQLPQGERIPVATTQVVVAVDGFTCPHCNVGVVTKETDMCCMLCLILLTIFTFPFGLVFLCCLPCTVSRRCSNCRRTV